MLTNSWLLMPETTVLKDSTPRKTDLAPFSSYLTSSKLTLKEPLFRLTLVTLRLKCTTKPPCVTIASRMLVMPPFKKQVQPSNSSTLRVGSRTPSSNPWAAGWTTVQNSRGGYLQASHNPAWIADTRILVEKRKKNMLRSCANSNMFWSRSSLVTRTCWSCFPGLGSFVGIVCELIQVLPEGVSSGNSSVTNVGEVQ